MAVLTLAQKSSSKARDLSFRALKVAQKMHALELETTFLSRPAAETQSLLFAQLQAIDCGNSGSEGVKSLRLHNDRLGWEAKEIIAGLTIM